MDVESRQGTCPSALGYIVKFDLHCQVRKTYPSLDFQGTILLWIPPPLSVTLKFGDGSEHENAERG
jgi:hypothetical protein